MANSVCIVSPGNLASNPRALKEADALHDAGYEVTAVVCNYTEALSRFDDEIAGRVPWKVVRVPRLASERYLHLASDLTAHVLATIGARIPLAIAVGAYGGPSMALERAASAVAADPYIAHYI